MAKTIIGVMGTGIATPQDLKLAYQLGKSIAENNWVLLTGGRKAGGHGCSKSWLQQTTTG